MPASSPSLPSGEGKQRPQKPRATAAAVNGSTSLNATKNTITSYFSRITPSKAESRVDSNGISEVSTNPSSEDELGTITNVKEEQDQPSLAGCDASAEQSGAISPCTSTEEIKITDSVAEHAVGAPAGALVVQTPHPSVTVQLIAPSHIPQLKQVTALLLPIKYPDSFFNTITTDPITSSISRVALYTPLASLPSSTPREPTVVGAIRCRLEPIPTVLGPPQHQIYIQTLHLLSPYRGTGVATTLLQSILSRDVIDAYNVDSIYAHVWEKNEDALEWYKRRGFVTEGGVVEGYYRRLRPTGAIVVRFAMRPQRAAWPGA